MKQMNGFILSDLILAMSKHYTCIVLLYVSVLTTDIATVWDTKAATWLAALHFMFSVGAFISPFTAEPFLSNIHDKELIHAVNGSVENITNLSTENVTGVFIKYDHFASVTINATLIDILDTESRIFIPLFISAVVCLISGLSFISVYLYFGQIYSKVHKAKASHDPESEYILTNREQNIMTVMTGIIVTMYIMSERGVTYFLMTFVVDNLSWSKSMGTRVTSLFYITFSIGRLITIFIVERLTPSRCLLINFNIFVISGGILLTAISTHIDALVWVGIATAGVGMSSIFSSVFAWQSTKIRQLTGVVVSGFIVSSSVGSMIQPVIVGHLMQRYTHNWFVYMHVILSCFMFLTFCLCLGFYQIKIKRFHMQHSTRTS